MLIETYSPVGDILTIALCFMCWAFLLSTYSIRQKNLMIFYVVTVSLSLVAVENIIFHKLLASGSANPVILITLENSIYPTMVALFLFFAIYLSNLFNLTQHSKYIIYGWGIPPFLIYTIWKCVKPFVMISEYQSDGIWYYSESAKWGFLGCYIYYCIGLLILIQFFRYRVAPKMMICLEQSIIIALTLAIIEAFIPSTTFLTVSFMFPILAALMLFHYNSYDVRTGSLDRASLPRYLQDNKQKHFGIYALKLKGFVFTSENSVALLFLQNASEIFKHYQLFRVADDTLFLVFNKQWNLHSELLDGIIHKRIKLLYQNFRIPYKAVYMDYHGQLIDGQDYIALFEDIATRMNWNEMHRCNFEDMSLIVRQSHLKHLFQEIERAEDLSHPNVKVYCQPIWNIKTQSYRSVEILSRLVCQNELIGPEDFLPFAIREGYIFTYNKVVFNKACKQFAELLKSENCTIETMSMNFSIQEFISPNFVSDVLDIIEAHNIPSEKIAIEIIETTGTSQVEEVKEVIWRLKTRGIKVYLDDFGTDYSNIDRILHWPVDVIKLDKSLTWSMRNNDQLCHIIKSIADSLRDSGYKILFEGVETDDDVSRCQGMSASYLQGFKYCKPMEFSCLSEFLQPK